MTAETLFALIGLAAAVGALVLAVLGWIVPLPDGARRFSYRLWSWLLFFAFLVTIPTHSGWWDWAWRAAAGGYSALRIGHWWRATEAARKVERTFPWGGAR